MFLNEGQVPTGKFLVNLNQSLGMAQPTGNTMSQTFQDLAFLYLTLPHAPLPSPKHLPVLFVVKIPPYFLDIPCCFLPLQTQNKGLPLYPFSCL